MRRAGSELPNRRRTQRSGILGRLKILSRAQRAKFYPVKTADRRKDFWQTVFPEDSRARWIADGKQEEAIRILENGKFSPDLGPDYPLLLLGAIEAAPGLPAFPLLLALVSRSNR